MISAKEARELARKNNVLPQIEAAIKAAAGKGEMGVWVPSIPLKAILELQKEKFCITHGHKDFSEKGDNKEGQDWIWWG